MRSDQEVLQAIEEYSDTVNRICFLYLKNKAYTEDIFQNVFMKYAINEKIFASQEHEKAWFIRVTINECKDLLKKFFRRKTVSLEDIKEKGAEAVFEEAWKIATERTKGVHISFDLDVIDPEIAPGVSIPEFDGISEEEAMKINECIIKHLEQITSYDLVEFNPLRDIDRKTEQIAINLLAQIIRGAENLKKLPEKIY